MRQLVVGVLLLGALADISDAETVTAYHIGNSLTQNLPLDWIRPWAQQRGHTYQAGRHIKLAGTLHTIWNSTAPSEFPVAPYGSYQEELPNEEFDVLTLQPFNEALDLAAARIKDFTALAVHTEQVYVLQTWPRYSHGEYRTAWEQIYTGPLTPINSRNYYLRLMDRLPESTRIIPTGEVLYELAGRVEAGTLPGIESMQEFYWEDVCTCHLNEFGSFALASTAYAIFFNESPVGFRAPIGMTEEAGRTIQEVAWAVASHHLQTGLTPNGDLDADGEVTLADYAKWKENYRIGISDALGYTAWRNAYVEPPATPDGAAIPEPTTWALLMFSISLVDCRRRSG